MLPIAGIAYILTRLVRQVGRRRLAATAGKPLRRASPASPRWPSSPASPGPGGRARHLPPDRRRTRAAPSPTCCRQLPARSQSRARRRRRSRARARGDGRPRRGRRTSRAHRGRAQLALVMVPREQGIEPGTEVDADAGRPGRRTDGRPADGDADGRARLLGLPVRPAAAARGGRQPGAGGQHHRRHRRLRRRVRPGLGRRRRAGHQHQRGLRLRQLRELRGRRGQLPGRPDRRRRRRRGAAEHRRRGQLRLRQLPDLRAGQPAGVTLDGPLSETGMAALRRALGRDRGVRPGHRPVAAGGAAGSPRGVPGPDQGHHPRGPRRAGGAAPRRAGDGADGQDPSAGRPRRARTRASAEATTEPSPTADTVGRVGALTHAEPSQSAPSDSAGTRARAVTRATAPAPAPPTAARSRPPRAAPWPRARPSAEPRPRTAVTGSHRRARRPLA